MFQYLIQLYVHITIVDGLGSIFIDKDNLVMIHYTHFIFDPVNNLFKVMINLNPPHLLVFCSGIIRISLFSNWLNLSFSKSLIRTPVITPIAKKDRTFYSMSRSSFQINIILNIIYLVGVFCNIFFKTLVYINITNRFIILKLILWLN